MTAPVELRREGDIAILSIDNPPVNALSHAVRAGLLDALKAVDADDSIVAAVIAGEGRTFSAGADIAEFDEPLAKPDLNELIAQADAMTKPLVAAIHGTALGGGLELALACHFRVAAEKARLGLPEVKLGLLPGAGGTQRLPRLVGPLEALKMIVTGDPVPAPRALEIGLIDALAEGDLSEDAIAFARKVIAEGRPLVRVRDRQDRLSVNPDAFEEAVEALTKRSRGLDAPQACVQSIRNALIMPFDEGLAAEAELFLKLLSGDQSRAQRHIFFAEREALKVPDMPKDTRAREVVKVAVIGAGTMGSGIAMCFANIDMPVALIDNDEDSLKRGLSLIEANYRASAAKGSMTPEEAKHRASQIKGSTSLKAAADADLVIEAVFEDMALKKQIFAELDRIAKPGAVLATNTSTLDVNEIAAATARPADVVGMHFFSPANVMKLLEVVRARATSHEALKTAMETGRRIGKVCVVSGVCFGFIGNRMLARRSAEAERLILEGATPQEVDQAAVSFGFPMGPFAVADLAGIDVAWRIRQATGEKAEISDALYRMGRFGQKTGKGFYIYEDGSRVPRPDPEVEALIVAASERLGVERRTIPREEIVERITYPMINEGARILAEGIAMRPGDIDVVWVYGYGWPVWRGGPMHDADRAGLAHIAERLRHYASRTGDESLLPAPLLARLAKEGRSFASLA